MHRKSAHSCRVLTVNQPFNIFTARNSSCGKVMFPQACVIPSVHRVGYARQGDVCDREGHAWQGGHACSRGGH